MDHYGYPVERIAVEKPVQFGSSVHDKAADIVVWDKDDKTAAQIIIECKKPKRKDGLEQLKSYLNLPLPDVVSDKQEEIADKVKESIAARREARRLLEEAKTMVEEAILGG